MCGIAGLYSFGSAAPPNKGELAAMIGALHHRGPDGSSTFVDGPTDPETPEERRARVLAIEEANVPKRASPEAWVRVTMPRCVWLLSAEWDLKGDSCTSTCATYTLEGSYPK